MECSSARSALALVSTSSWSTLEYMGRWTIPLARAAIALAGGIFVDGLWAYQKPFREYPAMEYSNFPLPPDYQQPAEFAFARLMYPDARGGRGFGFGRFGRDWREGYTNWTNDYP